MIPGNSERVDFFSYQKNRHFVIEFSWEKIVCLQRDNLSLKNKFVEEYLQTVNE